jgi:hypothetical protein
MADDALAILQSIQARLDRIEAKLDEALRELRGRASRRRGWLETEENPRPIAEDGGDRDGA